MGLKVDLEQPPKEDWEKFLDEYCERLEKNQPNDKKDRRDIYREAMAAYTEKLNKKLEENVIQGPWPAPQKAAPPPPPKIQTAADLRTKQFDEIKYVVPNYIAEGLTLLCAKPKVGKSWLMLDAALAIATGGDVLGQKVEQGATLYLALEDNERRLQKRINKILGPTGYQSWPDRFHFQTESLREHEGGIGHIEDWIKAVPQPRLVVIDVFQSFRPPQGRDNSYAVDYAAIQALQTLAGRTGIAIVVIHHLRKSPSESGDPFDEISGTLGLSGGADTSLVIRRTGQGATLYGRGRDVEEIESAIEFDRNTCRWKVLGPATEVHQSEERQKILEAIRTSGKPMTPKDIATATGMKPENVRYLIFKMVGTGTVKGGTGGYMLPDAC